MYDVRLTAQCSLLPFLSVNLWLSSASDCSVFSRTQWRSRGELFHINHTEKHHVVPVLSVLRKVSNIQWIIIYQNFIVNLDYTFCASEEKCLYCQSFAVLWKEMVIKSFPLHPSLWQELCIVWLFDCCKKKNVITRFKKEWFHCIIIWNNVWRCLLWPRKPCVLPGVSFQSQA